MRVVIFLVLITIIMGCGDSNPPPAAGPVKPAPPGAGAVRMPGSPLGAVKPPEPPVVEGPVAFTLSALELASAYDADQKEFASKYAGKRVEVTGVAGMIRQHSKTRSDVMMVGNPKAKSFFAQYVVAAPGNADATKYQSLLALAKGQSLTVRGTVGTFGLVIEKCEFVKVGPSTALPITPSALKAAFGTDEGKKKYNGQAVVLRAEVQKAEWNGTVATLTVTDPGKPKGPTLEASVNPNAKEIGEAIGKMKPGTIVIIMGDGDDGNDGRVWETRILTEPPEGIKLPDTK